jgi:hypothetical protein
LYTKSPDDALFCAKCGRLIDAVSAENDFLCNVHGMVNAIRKSDGAVLCGDGYPGETRILRYVGAEVSGKMVSR